VASIRPNDQKFRELILYIARRCEEDPNFGKTKLNKLLFYSDFIAYAQTGEPITGQEYMRIEHGPGARKLKPILEDMQRRGEVRIQRERKIDHDQQRILALRDPRLDEFSDHHLGIVNQIIQYLWGRTNRQVSALSHADIGWQLARYKETIPYETVFLSDRPLTEAELEYGRQLAAELGR
jgi:Protein of unknown function (DUF4065)